MEEKPYRSKEWNVLFILGLISIVFIVIRSYRLFSFPSEFMTDEINDIILCVKRSLGGLPLFGFDNYASAGNLEFILISFFVPLIKTNLEAYRVFPVFYNLLLLFGIYLTANELFGKRTALLSACALLFSFMNYFDSRLFISNNLMMVFMVYGIYAYIRYLKGSKPFIYIFAVLFILGADTYVNFILLVPTLLAASVLYRADNKRSMASAGVLILLSSVLYLYLAQKTGIFTWALSKFSETPMYGLKSDPWEVISRLKYLFIQGHYNYDYYPVNMPFFNPVEALLLAMGLVIAVINLRKREYALTLACFFIFLAPLFAGTETKALRIIQIQIPVAILIGAALNGIIRMKWVFTGVICLFAGAQLYMISNYFSAYEKQIVRFSSSKNIAGYMNRTFGKTTRYISALDPEQPELVLYRLPQYYDMDEKTGKISFKVNAYWLEFLAGYVDDKKADIAVFPPDDEHRYPFALVTVDQNSRTGKDVLSAVSIIAKGKETMISELGKDHGVLVNTLLSELAGYNYTLSGDYENALKTYYSKGRVVWITADRLNKMAKLEYALGREMKGKRLKSEYEIKKQVLLKTMKE